MAEVKPQFEENTPDFYWYVMETKKIDVRLNRSDFPEGMTDKQIEAEFAKRWLNGEYENYPQRVDFEPSVTFRPYGV